MKKLLLCFLLGGVHMMMAQEGDVLTLSQAIEYALENKADAEKARLDIQQGDAQIAEVRATAFPQVSVNGNTTFNPLLQETVLPGEIFGIPGENVRVAFGQKWTSNASAQLNQVLFNQSVFTGLKAARSTKEFYLINAQLTEEQIIEKVAVAYYRVYEVQQMLKNLEDNLDLTERTVEIVKGLFENGLVRKIDYDRSKVALNNISASRQQLLNALANTENALKFMIGMPGDIEIMLPDQTFTPLYLPDRKLGGMGERTEIALMNKQLELLQWQRKATEAEYYPSVSFVANYGWLGQGRNVPLWNGEEQGVFWSDFSTVGLNVQIPVFNGNATKSRVQLNQIAIEKTKADIRDTRLALELAYNNARAQLENSWITIENQEENVTLAREVLTDTQHNYGLGLATLNDLLDAERALADANNNLTNAQINYRMAEIELLKSQGKLRTLK